MKRVLALTLLLPVAFAREVALEEESFQIIPQKHEKDIFEIYSNFSGGGQEVVVTTDLVLHTMHLLFDYTLRAVELEKMVKSLESLAADLMEESAAGAVGEDEPLRTAHRRNVAFLGVVLRCLKPDAKIPDYAEAAVKKDLEFIRQHQAFDVSAALPHKEDFSQYVPRGHYTRNETFERFFRAMMWCGRRMFRVAEKDPMGAGQPKDPWSPEEARMETRQALLLVGMLHHTKGAIELWKQIDDIINVFVGEADDLTLYDYAALSKEIYGGIPDRKELFDDGRLDRFIAAAEKLSQPRIDSSGMGRKGFNLIGQRSVPDSVITQGLAYSTYAKDRGYRYTGSADKLPFTAKNTPVGIVRAFPRGLDVMAVFGSDLAREILRGEGDDRYEKFDENLKNLRTEFEPKLSDSNERKSVYWDWLYSVQPLLQDAPEGAPKFMHDKAWKKKMLATSLASWAELRHDTILYVKQSYSGAGRGMPPKPEFGYVEPYPEVYARAAATISRLRKLLDARGVGIKGFQDKYESFEEVLAFLERIARAELKGERIAAKDHLEILAVPWKLRTIAKLSEEWAKKLTSATDQSMAIVADVHTDNNPKPEVLEEGVGLPSFLKVTVSVNGSPRTFWGAVYTYYEFRWPKEDRLTDEKWQKMLEEGKAPAPPPWTKP